MSARSKKSEAELGTPAEIAAELGVKVESVEEAMRRMGAGEDAQTEWPHERARNTQVLFGRDVDVILLDNGLWVLTTEPVGGLVGRRGSAAWKRAAVPFVDQRGERTVGYDIAQLVSIAGEKLSRILAEVPPGKGGPIGMGYVRFMELVAGSAMHSLRSR